MVIWDGCQHVKKNCKTIELRGAQGNEWTQLTLKMTAGILQTTFTSVIKVIKWSYLIQTWSLFLMVKFTGDPLHNRAACTQPCNVNTHSRAHCSPRARLCEQWGHGCVNNGARLCASAWLCRGSPVKLASCHRWFGKWHGTEQAMIDDKVVIMASIGIHRP